jgi:hypothetical protein
MQSDCNLAASTNLFSFRAADLSVIHMRLIPSALVDRLGRRPGPIGWKTTDAVRWAMAWSALMAGFAWLFVRVWLDPASGGERRERAAFLKRIVPFRRKRPPGAADKGATVGLS